MARMYSISKLFRASALFITLAVSSAISVIVIYTQYSEFKNNTAAYEQEYVRRQQDILTNEMDHATDLIRYERSKITNDIKNDLKQKTLEAYDIASVIYYNNKNTLPESSIKKIIIDSLNSVSFYDGRGYYWIHDVNYILVMNRFRPGMIGKNDFDLSDLSGKKIIQSFIRIGTTAGEGFDTYYWNRPGQSIALPKISYLKLFPPFGWIIGTGEYLDDVELSVQESIKRRLSLFKNAESSVIRILDFGGTVLFDPSGVYAQGENILELQDSNGRMVVHDILSEGLKAEGGFGYLELPKSKSEAAVTNLFYARTVPGWGWILVATVPLDRMTEVVFQHKDSLRATMVRQIGLILGSLAVAALAVLTASTFVSRRLRKEFAVFLSFFRDAPKHITPINYDSLHVVELKSLAESANQMSREIQGKSRQLEDEVEVRRLTEIELVSARNAFQGIIDSMPSVVIGVNTDMVITHWNTTAEEATGINASLVIGKQLSEALPTVAERIGTSWDSLMNGTPLVRNKMALSFKDKLLQVDMLAYPLISNGVKGAVIRLDDVTERVRMEEMMIQTEKVMSVGGLAAGMAHEINNPLGGILQSVQVIIRRLNANVAANTEAAEEAGCPLDNIQSFLVKRDIPVMLEGIRQSAERAAKIVANMLEFSRKTDASMGFVNMTDLMEKAVELCSKDYDLKKKYDFKQIDILWDSDPALPLVQCSPTQIEQVFMNILRNAAQAMSVSKVLSPKITLRTRNDGEFARIEIEDNGPGMEETTRRKVFEPFFSTKPPGEGTGLGLSVSFFIITNNHAGTITVESELGSGTTFIIKLPYTQDRREA
ncbi:MAG: cache domain-containing protein [Desulfovibrio sp.]|nr:cache domain-containing protein [Desulfovibrio sp.]